MGDKHTVFFAQSSAQFKFNNQVHRQKNGVAMGPSLGPILTDIFSQLTTPI